MDRERQWLIFSSFALSLALFIFFCTAPALRYPLKWPDSIGLLEIILPVFIGYLSSASVWAFGGNRPPVPPNFQIDLIRKALLRGPILLVSLMLATVLTVFGYSNGMGAPDGTGMTVSQLTTFVTIALGILAVTTGVGLVALFPRQDADNPPTHPGV